MKKSTPHEKALEKIFSESTGVNFNVSESYQQKLNLIQEHLQFFYSDRANWQRNLQIYFRSPDFQCSCRTVSTCEDMPILSTDEIEKMIDEDDSFQNHLNELNALVQTFSTVKQTDFALLERAAKMIGIWPEQQNDSIFNWFIYHKNINDLEIPDIIANLRKNKGRLSVIINLISQLFISGMTVTFPLVETVMTQQIGKHFYRGENAYYPSSKPGFFRRNSSYNDINRLQDILRIDEAGFFLDQFDAIKKWSASTVNYLALAQHYGIRTPMMDVTSDLKTALFFACCTREKNKWRPLNNNDFRSVCSRSDTKDSRYGILFRSSSEISTLKWATNRHPDASELITPIGYQPFMRCSAQFGYMLLTQNSYYNMQRDPLFEKFRIELSEDFCQWIFETMDEGKKVYPDDDIPNIEEYMRKTRDTNVISYKTFYAYATSKKLSTKEVQVKIRELQMNGMTVFDGAKEFINHNRLQKINKQYDITTAESKLKDRPVSNPLLFL